MPTKTKLKKPNYNYRTTVEQGKDGLYRVFGFVNEKIVYVSKAYKHPGGGGTSRKASSWLKRVEKQVRNGRVFVNL